MAPVSLNSSWRAVSKKKKRSNNNDEERRLPRDVFRCSLFLGANFNFLTPL